MNLINRYVYAVTRHLPHSQRKEVADELSSTIQDMVADRAKDKKPSTKAVESVLKELGNPDTLALQYSQGPRYLISPKWFAIYWRLITKLIIIVPLIFAALALVGALIGQNTLIQIMLTTFGAGLGAAVQVAFWVTLIFAIMEWTQVEPSKTALTSDWSIEDLPELPKKRQIGRADSVANVVFVTFAFLLVMAAAIVPATWINASVPVLNPSLLPVWILLFAGLVVLELILEIFKYRIGNWTPALAIANVLLNTLNVIYFVTLATTQVVVNPAFTNLMRAQLGDKLDQIAQWPLIITITIIVISCVLSAVESVIKSIQLKKS